MQEWDIDALEESTRYDGFTVDHPVIMLVQYCMPCSID